MRPKLSRAERQRIVDEFAERHGGVFDKREFLAEVRESNGSHPAWSWFEWRDDVAAEAYRLQQAGDFVRDLVLVVEVVTPRSVTLNLEAPAMLVPLADRREGGYRPLAVVGVEELRREAVMALIAWRGRYQAALAQIGALDAADKLIAKIRTD